MAEYDVINVGYEVLNCYKFYLKRHGHPLLATHSQEPLTLGQGSTPRSREHQHALLRAARFPV